MASKNSCLMEPLLLIGAGGHARAAADVIKAEGRYSITGLIDSFQNPGALCFGYRVLGREQDIPRLCQQFNVYNAIVAIGDNYQRWAMMERITAAVPNINFISAVHPSAIVAADIKLGSGVVIMPGAVLVTGCEIGDGCLINTAASLDHDGYMAGYSSLAPGVVTGGRVRIGQRSSLGLGAKVIHNITIGADTVIGAGALVLRNVPELVVAYGYPCRVVKQRAPDEPYL